MNDRDSDETEDIQCSNEKDGQEYEGYLDDIEQESIHLGFHPSTFESPHAVNIDTAASAETSSKANEFNSPNLDNSTSSLGYPTDPLMEFNNDINEQVNDQIREALKINEILAKGRFGQRPAVHSSDLKSSAKTLLSHDDSLMHDSSNFDLTNQRGRKGFYVSIDLPRSRQFGPSNSSKNSSRRKLLSPRRTNDNNKDGHIIGQEWLESVDGSALAYFNLKIIFDPNTTGFEDKVSWTL